MFIEIVWLGFLGLVAVLWGLYLMLEIKIIKRFIRRVFVLIINLIFNNRIFWAIIGVINKRFKFIKTIFLAYPANYKFATEYVFDNALNNTRWNPWFTGFFIQNGKIGIKFAISSTEIDFRDETNLDNLRNLWLKMNYLKQLIVSDQMTFAGVLPGIFYKKNIIPTLPIELENTVKAVKKTVISITNYLKLKSNTPIIVLGGKGFIGNKFVDEMSDKKVYIIDKKDGNSSNDIRNIINSIKDKVIILNIATPKAIQENLLYFNEKVIIINEVYPEPDIETSRQIKNQGALLFHIVGVKGKSFPKFPRAYRNGIPCCASWDSDNISVEFIQI